MGQRFTIKTSVVGRGKEEDKEARILNRVIRVTPSGWEYEADQRHGELITKTLGIDDCKPVISPGEDAKEWEAEQDEVRLDGVESKGVPWLGGWGQLLGPGSTGHPICG